MPGQRKNGKKRVDFFLDEEERRVFNELKSLSSSKTMSDVLRFMLEKTAIANGIKPPRRMPEDGGDIGRWSFTQSGSRPETKKAKSKRK